MLQSYAFYPEEIPFEKWYEVIKCVEKWEKFIIKAVGYLNLPEARQRIIQHCLTHPYHNLDAYICKLANVIMIQHSKEVPIDFTEQVMHYDDNTDLGTGSTNKNKNGANPLEQENFADGVVEKLIQEENDLTALYNIILEYPEEFLKFCLVLVNQSTTKEFDRPFSQKIYSLRKDYENYTDTIKAIYSNIGEDLNLFLTEETGWAEADFTLAGNKLLQNLHLVNVEDETTPVLDADVEPFYVRGLRKGYHVYRVRYFEAWDFLCELISSDTSNVAKFCLNNRYLFRLPSGYISGINQDISTGYDLIREEIVTNVLKYFKTRYIHTGSEYVYLVSKNAVDIPPLKTTIFGNEFEFVLEDITSKVVMIND